MRFKNVNFLIIFLNLAPWFFIFLNLYQLQFVQAGNFNISIEKIENSQFRVIPPKRGFIYVKDKDNNFYPVAISVRRYNLYFNPGLSQNIQKDFKRLQSFYPETSALEVDPDKTILVEKNLDEEAKKRLEELSLGPIFFEEYYQRVYPEKNLLATIIGFAAKSDEGFLDGQYGLESYYNKTLRGEEGYRLSFDKIQAPISGRDIVLNIDYFVQKEAEKVLRETVKEFEAQGGLIAISQPNGKIIALAEEPSFDLNKFNEISDYKIFLTQFVQNYEPGSVMKAITYLSAIENNVFNENQTYVDTGYVEINGWKISNFDKKGRGQVTLAEALEQSLNTGAVYVEKLIGHSNFLETLKKFGFHQPAQVDLPYLNEGNLKNLFSQESKDVNFATASFGHGLSIAPAHLLAALNTIASVGSRNNLRLMMGTIANGRVQEEKPIRIKNILKPSSIPRLNELLERVIVNGSGKKTKIAGFRIGGKTGSAFIPLENQKGYSEDVINTFLVIFPLTSPRFTMLVRIDRPTEGLARVTTVPAAKKMIEFLINYYNIQPDNPQELVKMPSLP